MYFSVVFIYLLYLLKTKHVLSAEWKLQILAGRGKLEVVTGQEREGHARDSAVSGCNLEMWGIQLACPSLSSCLGTDLPGPCETNQRVMFSSALYSTAKCCSE